jgi:hypothetical protein
VTGAIKLTRFCGKEEKSKMLLVRKPEDNIKLDPDAKMLPAYMWITIRTSGGL